MTITMLATVATVAQGHLKTLHCCNIPKMVIRGDSDNDYEDENNDDTLFL